ncbi:hypothetical protein B0H13DRAFT_1878557 [Mycena leptocephala]|nr:hypothetical protein B0H13DRAFT_1878557 [Mycena leptocephala]
MVESRKSVHGMDTGALAKHSTFGRRMDVLFGATARNADGRMTQIRRGPSGIKLLLQYLRKINRQTDGILLTVATLKLTQLLEEIQCLCPSQDTDPSSAAPSTASA